ncbi:MAG: energy transducer TonB, partial [Terriglobia bacterium]
VTFDAIKPEPSYLASQRKVLIQLPILGTPSGEALRLPLYRIFYANMEEVAKDLPPEIRELLDRKKEPLTSKGEKIYKFGEEVEPPKPLKSPRPHYPDVARAARISGTVVLAVIVDTEGNTNDVKLISGHPMLTQEAMITVRDWKYKPATRNGIPVPFMLEVNVSFDIRYIP